jgi:sugar lactone lactonase YvrE
MPGMRLTVVLAGSLAAVAVAWPASGAAVPAAPPAPGTITTIAGTGKHKFNGDHRKATTANLFQPADVAVDRRGNVYIADGNSRVRKINRRGTITTIAGCGHCFGTHGTGRETRGRSTRIVMVPTALALDGHGGLYVGTPSQIWRVKRGRARLIAGHPWHLRGDSGDGGPARKARLTSVWGMAVDSRGNVVFADSANQRVRKITPRGRITTLAGTGERGFSGDGGPGAAAQLNWPKGVAVDRHDNIYIADSLNHRVRRITPDGTISTLAGNGADYPFDTNYDGDDATDVPVVNPNSLTVDRYGNMFVYVSGGLAVVDASGRIRTVAVSGRAGEPPVAIVDGIAVDRHGNLFMADTSNDRVRKVARALG